jgi:hypothetical protein
VYYHSTTPENADLILRNGIDVSKYRSGMFVGFYLSAEPRDLGKATLAIDIDEKQIMDVNDVGDDDLTTADPHWRGMSYGWKNTLISRMAKERGFHGVRNGKDVILFDDKPIRKIVNY